MNRENQFALLRTRRFLPFFMTQLLGVLNDNIYKNALMLILIFKFTEMTIETNTIMNLAAGLFILPFFLFSGIAGRIADRYDKALLIRRLKLAEILIMVSAACALAMESHSVMMFLLFCMGTQSAFFGPIKYSIIPQHLNNKELVGGNALVEMGTFLAILVGTLMAGILVGLDDYVMYIGVVILLLAALGYLCSRQIPSASANQPNIEIGINILTYTVESLKKSYRDRKVFMAILAISWFWFLGASYLTQIPNFVKIQLGGNNEVVTIVLATFSIGIAVGSLLCEMLSRRTIELGIVPIGSMGISLFGIALYSHIPESSLMQVGASAFLSSIDNIWVLVNITMIGIFGGLFIVPLYAWVQNRSNPVERSQIISAINIMNSLFMVISAVVATLFLGVLEWAIPHYFLMVALANIVVAAYVYYQVPVFVARFVIWMLSHTLYRVRHIDLHHIPEKGAAVIVCNHVSYMDALIMGGAIQRPIRFVMNHKIYHTPALNWLFKIVNAIPIASKTQCPEIYERAMGQVSDALSHGELVCIFPEGQLTRDGEIDTFRRGIETIIEQNPVPVIPMALNGMWGSFFSHEGGKILQGSPKRFWSKISLVASNAIKPEYVSANALRDRVLALSQCADT